MQRYRERLIPSFGLFAVLLLFIPAVALVLMPIQPAAAIPGGIGVYLLVALTLVLLSPTVSVERGKLSAGRAAMPVSLLGEIELLGADELRAAIGPGTDARNYLVVRGYIHRGVRIENSDPNDPTPYWVITTRHPQKLADAITSARG